MKCQICNKEIKGYDNNAWPIVEGRCCSECNEKLVVPVRLFLAGCLKDKILVLTSDDNQMYLKDVQEELSLKEAQEIVKGYIELIPIKHDKFYFIINEEGLIKNLKPNKNAKRLFRFDIVGNLIVCPKELFV